MSQQLGTVEILLKAVDEMSTTLRKTEDALSSLKTTTEETGQKTSGLSGFMTQLGVNVMSLGSTISGLGGPFESLGSVIMGFGKGGFVGAAIAGVGELTNALKWSVTEATESEAVWASLGAAVERSGQSWQTLKKGTEDALLAMTKTTTYSDEQLAQVLEKLMTFGLSYDQAMQALGKTIDFAAAKHMDLDSAATLVGKAMDGNTSILKRYGVDITTTKDATAALKDAHNAAKIAIDGMGTGVDGWVASVTTAIGATTEFQTGLAGAKDKAGYLIEQFQQGNIDLPQFTEAMTSLGVPLDEAKLKAGGAEEVLGALNKQFGGAAQTQANTYAGIQERLKNATSELGEKIGGMVLPALAGMTEAMIPVVDWFGKGLDSIQAWLTEVGKMPEVQAVMAVVNEAFQGFWNYLNDVWKFIQDTFGPALQELWSAFKDLWDALSPIGEALSELLSVFGDIGSIDLLKMVLQAVVLEIRGVAAIIKEVAPYIKAFAQGFKEAAGFITPILKQVVDAIEWFCGAVKLGFQTLYTWLVGGSLWMDMWNALLSVASSMTGMLLGDLGAKLLKPMQDAFMGAMQGVQDLWDKGWQNLQAVGQTAWDLISGGAKVWEDLFRGDFQGALDQITQNWDISWQAVQTTFTTISDQIGGALNTKFDAMKSFVQANLGEYAPIATSALNAMQAATNVGLALIRGDWQGALDNIQGMLKGATEVMQGVWQGFSSWMSGAVSTFQGAVSSASDWLGSTLAGMQSAASSALGGIEGMISAAWGSVSSALSGMANDVWSAVSQATTQASSTVSTIVAALPPEAVPTPTPFGGPQILQTDPGEFWDIARSGLAWVDKGEVVGTPPESSRSQSISLNIPVTVQVDSQTVARQVQTRIVRSIDYQGRH